MGCGFNHEHNLLLVITHFGNMFLVTYKYYKKIIRNIKLNAIEIIKLNVYILLNKTA